MAKTDKLKPSQITQITQITQLVKFLVITAIFVFIDMQFHLSEIILTSFNLINTSAARINYLPMYASISITLSSDLVTSKKIILSIILFLSYISLSILLSKIIIDNPLTDQFLLFIYIVTISIPISLYDYLNSKQNRKF